MTLPTHHPLRAARIAAAGAAVLAVGVTSTGHAQAESPRSASVSDGTLTVTGTEGDDDITLRLAPGAPQTLQVAFGADGATEFEIDRTTFSAIEVDARNGDDRFRVDQLNGAFADEELTVVGGNGDDVLDGGDGAERFVSGPGDDHVDGNRGADDAVLGSGTDTFRWDQGDGSDVVDGSAGFDTLDFRGFDAAETMSLTPQGEQALFFRQQGSIRMELDRVERLDLRPLGGADSFTVADLSATDIVVVDVDLAAASGAADAAVDTVTVEGTAGADVVDVVVADDRVVVEGLAASTRIAGNETTDRLVVNTLGGPDEVSVDDDVAPRIAVEVDLGDGQV
jgi:Ca2+-binding RTX toxin-like protein